jgi:transcriptional regulator with XRE-family HTH domain
MPAPLRARLGRAVRRLRAAAGYSQEGFADAIRVHRTYVGSVERGEVNLSLDNLERVATGLGLAPWELLREAEGENGPEVRGGAGRPSPPR